MLQDVITPYDTELIVKVFVAALFGALVGYERQRYQKPAGVRTQMLICMGSALLAGLSIDIALQHTAPEALVRPDPTRLMAQIIAGIGFIGGGVILKGNDKVSGVTTAATIWLTAAIGIAVGAGFYVIAGACVILALLTHPISRLKHTSTPKNVPYVIRTSKKHWLKMLALIEDIPLEYQVTKISSTKCEVRIYSTREAKNSLVKAMSQAELDFEMTTG